MMDMNIYSDVDKLTIFLKNFFIKKQYISVAYLFGSTIKGKSREKSDIDIAVLFCDGIDAHKRFEYKLDLADELEELLCKKIDIVDLESADLFFVHQILLDKVLVFERNLNTRVEFEVKSRREYFDMLPFYELYQRQAMLRLDGRSCNG